jgi:hypothetical protein
VIEEAIARSGLQSHREINAMTVRPLSLSINCILLRNWNLASLQFFTAVGNPFFKKMITA